MDTELLDKFILAVCLSDILLGRIKEQLSDHLGVSPDDITWENVLKAKEVYTRLSNVLKFVEGDETCVIEVTESAGNDKVYVEVNGEDATDAERPFVEGVAADVYADFEWVVYNETEWECPACLHLNTEAGETVFPFCAVCGTEKEG